MIPWLPREPAFPPVETALSEPDGPNGLLAAGGDLSPERVLSAYCSGIFPWYSAGEPILWWSPDPRMVLFPHELRVSHSLAKTLKQQRHEVRLDTAFAQVLAGCAEPRKGVSGTWIVPEMQAAYHELHELGFAHSVETWIDGRLAGGLYGVAIGRVFYGESMFSLVSNASKIALAHLCRYLEQRGFAVIDCQMTTPHLASLGAHEIPRREFLSLLARWTRIAAKGETEGALSGKWPADGASHLFG